MPVGRLLLWLQPIVLPDLYWKGRRAGDRRSLLWQFSYWKVISNTDKGGLKADILLLVTGSCFEGKFDNLSCLEITSSLEHVLLLCVIKKVWKSPLLQVKLAKLYSYTSATLISRGRIWPSFGISISTVFFLCLRMCYSLIPIFWR